jgi:hypothetical protein
MKALSLWQPWCFAILHLGKDVENRSWWTSHRGPLLLHAAKRRPTLEECRSFVMMAEGIVGADELAAQLSRAVGLDFRGRVVDALRALPRGGIVGRVNVVDCGRGLESPWAFDGQWQWVVRNPVPVPIIETRGWQGLFNIDTAQLARRVTEAT